MLIFLFFFTQRVSGLTTFPPAEDAGSILKHICLKGSVLLRNILPSRIWVLKDFLRKKKEHDPV